MIKYTIGWEWDGKEALILSEKYEYQFPSFSPCNEFCCIFLCYGKLMGKPMDFLYAEVYHRIGIGWEKRNPYYGKSISTNFPDSPHTMGFVAFSHTMGSCWQNLCISCMMRFINFFL